MNSTRIFAEGVVQLGIGRQVIHGKERNGIIDSNFRTVEHDTSNQESGKE